ncbi:hypothetical protein [Niveibacterium sp. SC-1]|uniref:hypothetical protein n=1 Tax=Niveibacterium sp. SC-1 TaxID=3135646 RepID=UPI00312048C4
MSKQHRIAGAAALVLAALATVPAFAGQTINEARSAAYKEAAENCPMMNARSTAPASVQHEKSKIGFDWSKVPAAERERFNEFYKG